MTFELIFSMARNNQCGRKKNRPLSTTMSTHTLALSRSLFSSMPPYGLPNKYELTASIAKLLQGFKISTG
jgi:hypothetical protein